MCIRDVQIMVGKGVRGECTPKKRHMFKSVIRHRENKKYITQTTNWIRHSTPKSLLHVSENDVSLCLMLTNAYIIVKIIILRININMLITWIRIGNFRMVGTWIDIFGGTTDDESLPPPHIIRKSI